MAEQSRLARLGLRLGIVGLSTSLMIAAPLANGNYDPTCHTDAARIGWYADRTAGSEALKMVVGGVGGESVTRVGGNSVNWVLNSPFPSFTVGDGTGQPNVYGNSTTNIATGLQVKGSGNFRWTILKSSVAETGGNTGSSLAYGAWDDAGVFIDQPISVFRASGSNFTINRPFLVSSTFTTNVVNFSITVTLNNGAVTFNSGMLRVNITDTASVSASLISSYTVGANVIWSIRKDGVITHAARDDLTSSQMIFNRAFTLTGNLTDPFQMNFNVTLNGAFTVTRYNWIELDNPTGAATITDATVFRFDAAAGTHKCIDAATTKTTVATVNAWIKHNVNGTIYYSQCYTSKTT